MKELSTVTKKRLIWLLEKTHGHGGKFIISFSESKFKAPIDVVLYDMGDHVIEFLIKPSGEYYLTSEWAFRIALHQDLKDSSDGLAVYPSIWRDNENGIFHLVQWIEDKSAVVGLNRVVDFNVVEMPFYDNAIDLIEEKINQIWKQHRLPSIQEK